MYCLPKAPNRKNKSTGIFLTVVGYMDYIIHLNMIPSNVILYN